MRVFWQFIIPQGNLKDEDIDEIFRERCQYAVYQLSMKLGRLYYKGRVCLHDKLSRKHLYVLFSDVKGIIFDELVDCRKDKTFFRLEDGPEIKIVNQHVVVFNRDDLTDMTLIQDGSLICYNIPRSPDPAPDRRTTEPKPKAASSSPASSATPGMPKIPNPSGGPKKFVAWQKKIIRQCEDNRDGDGEEMEELGINLVLTGTRPNKIRDVRDVILHLISQGLASEHWQVR